MSYIFSNTGDYIRVGIGGSTSFTVPSTGSFLVWVKTNISDYTQDYSFFDSRDNPVTHLFGITFFNGAVYAGWNDVSGGNDYRVITGLAIPSNGVWANLIVTWNDVINETKLYLNGVQKGSTVTSLVTYDTSLTDDQYIGNDRNLGEGASSTIAYYAFWNRILTGTEISNLQTCPPSSAAPSNRVHEWDLLTNALDSIGSNNGTVSGATLNSGDGPSLPCSGGRGLFRAPTINGVGIGGSFFRDPLAAIGR